VKRLARLALTMAAFWRDGSTALFLDPLELLERLAALVSPPAAAFAALANTSLLP
jgi:hypothetical protein